MKVIMFKVSACSECPAANRRQSYWSHTKPVCILFNDENEPERCGKEIPEYIYSNRIPSWCPLDNMIEVEDVKYEITANKTVTEPKYGWSRLKDMLITWKEII